MSGTGTRKESGLRSAVPDFTILELGITIACTRRPAPDYQQIADAIARWFRVAVTPQDVELPVHRMISRDCMRVEERGFEPTESGRFQAEQTARALIRLVFRDRFFFDVGKLLDVTIVKEDTGHA